MIMHQSFIKLNKMKANIVTISAIAILAIGSFSVFSQENENAAKARKDMNEAKRI